MYQAEGSRGKKTGKRCVSNTRSQRLTTQSSPPILAAVSKRSPQRPNTGSAVSPETKARILDGAAQAFGKLGYSNVRVEDIRSHLIQVISGHRYDVTHKLEKLRSPFSLVLTKTQDSFNRTLKRYQLDRELLKALPMSE